MPREVDRRFATFLGVGGGNRVRGGPRQICSCLTYVAENLVQSEPSEKANYRLRQDACRSGW